MACPEGADGGKCGALITHSGRYNMLDRFSILISRIATVSLEDLKREEGQTTVEYAVVITLVIAMAILAFAALSTAVQDFMGTIATQLSGAAAKI